MPRSNSIFRAVHRSVAMFALVLCVPLAARAATPAESFVQSQIDTGIGLMQDKSLSAADRHARMHAFLLSLLDTHRIALYTLGDAKDRASPSDIAAYSDAFRDFMAASYESRLGGYEGQTLRITGSVEHAPGDYVVTTVLVDPSDQAGGQAPPEVDLRVVDEGGRFYVVDASIEGIWLAVAQHDDCVGFLQQHGGDVAALTAHLRDMTTQLLASTPQ